MTLQSTRPAWAADATEVLRDLGFTLRHGDRPASPGGAELLVALRDRPTLRHFDPELITCWMAVGGRGRAEPIDRRTAAGTRAILWGHVHVVDRLAVENRFLTFGGELGIVDIDATLRIVRHASPGPVVRWGGHSQGSDPLAGAIGAFFGRLIIAVDYTPGAEARIAAEPPEDLYAAFLRDTDARRRDAVRRADPERDAQLRSWLGAETARIRDGRPEAWAAAGRLLDDLDLGPEGLATERALAARAEAGRAPGG